MKSAPNAFRQRGTAAVPILEWEGGRTRVRFRRMEGPRGSGGFSRTGRELLSARTPERLSVEERTEVLDAHAFLDDLPTLGIDVLGGDPADELEYWRR